VVDKVNPNTKFFNDCELTPSDWITLTYTLEDNTLARRSNCQMEVTCNVSTIKQCSSDAIAPILVLSFDGEMYSNDGCFPSVAKGDTTIYIGASFWTYGTPIDKITRIMLGVGDVTRTVESDVTLVTFATSRELMEAFRDIIVAADPDVVTGWNTYGFDFPFLHADYESYFLPAEERGSEADQIAAIHSIRRILGLDAVSINTAATMYSNLRAKRNMTEWTKKAEKEFGARNIKIIKSGKDSQNLSLFGMTEAEEETDLLSASIAAKIRRSLRDFELGKMASASRANVSFRTFLYSATPDQQSAFYAENPPYLRAPAASFGRGMFLSRIASEKCTLMEKRMNNAAKGDNTYYFWTMTGRTTVDLMQIIKDDKKPDDNSLRHAAETYLTDSAKMDLSAEEMFAAYRNGPDFRWPIVEYCARDCDIPLRLIEKLKYIPIWTEMSRVCFTSSQEVVNSGQQVKVFNLIARFVWNEFAINVRDSGWPESDVYVDDKKRKPDYQGATVIEPSVGFYEDCISTLDFESLYPSIIRYYNLCPSTLVLDGYSGHTETHEIQHNILQGIVHGEPLYKEETRKYTFVNHVQGVLPRLLKRLIDARKSVKVMMANEKDPLIYAVLNGRQNGIKVACNSVYGFCGVAANRGLLPCKPVAAVTTLKGRLFIDAAKEYVEKSYPGSKVIYGDTDSIMIYWGHIDVPEAAAKGIEAADAITTMLRSGSVAAIGGAGSLDNRDVSEACSAVKLAYEKTYRPYLLLKKKNYAGLKYTQSGTDFKTEIDMKGIDAVRRDRPKLLRDTSNAILEALLNKRSAAKALESMEASLKKIASGQSPIEDYVLSKSLKSHYASDNVPHLMAWKRMVARGDEDIPPIGSRMPFIVVSGHGKLYERTEHPSHVKKAKLVIDRTYYVETLKNPLIKLLQFAVPEAKLHAVFRAAIERAALTDSGIGCLRSFATDTTSTVSGKKRNLLDFSSGK
jgi:DNA polymerase elongation subunit (family B)